MRGIFRRAIGPLTVVGLVACLPGTAGAQVVQGFQAGVGLFMLKRKDLRAAGDVLATNLDSLSFDLTKLNSAELFGEWLWAFGDHVELAAGASVYSDTVRSHYRYYNHPASDGGGNIEQELALRVVPITGVVRFFGGRPGDFQPYGGVGLSAMRFRYRESGEFIEFSDLSTYKTEYVAKGMVLGPVLMLGLRAPVYGDVWGLTFEWRYQHGVGKTGGLDNGFLDDRIDLSGHHVNFAWLVRF